MRFRRRRRNEPAFQYSRWDGSQSGFDFDADDLFRQITDDLVYHGDVNDALRRLCSRASTTATASGCRASARCSSGSSASARTLDQHELGGVYDEIAESCARSSRWSASARAAWPSRRAQSGDQRQQEFAREHATQRRQLQLDMMPARSRRPGAGAAELRLHGRRRTPEVRAADGRAARADDAADAQPDVRRHAEHVTRGHAAHEGHAERAQPDARTAGARRRARLRRVHGALRRLLPRQPADARRVARAAGAARWPRCSRC